MATVCTINSQCFWETQPSLYQKGSSDSVSVKKWNKLQPDISVNSDINLSSIMYEKSALAPQSSFSPVTSYHGLCHCILQPWIMAPPHKLTVSYLSSTYRRGEGRRGGGRFGYDSYKADSDFLQYCARSTALYCLKIKLPTGDIMTNDFMTNGPFVLAALKEWQRLSNLQMHQPHTLQK